jgi:hypothetical protein
MRIEKVIAVGAKFTYKITLSNIILTVEAYDEDMENGYEIIVYFEDTEKAICFLDAQEDINNGMELWDFLIGSHELIIGIWKNI